MSIEEKIQTMESIWEDLCKTADSTLSPPWHEKVLEQREENVKSGKEKFVDWDLAKKNIRNEIS
ncbi:MAG: addiction module protein [Leptospirales bacterium]